jgi:hypothetical protein
MFIGVDVELLRETIDHYVEGDIVCTVVHFLLHLYKQAAVVWQGSVRQKLVFLYILLV